MSISHQTFSRIVSPTPNFNLIFMPPGFTQLCSQACRLFNTPPCKDSARALLLTFWETIGNASADNPNDSTTYSKVDEYALRARVEGLNMMAV